mgnify:CR=1 FL=1
MAAMAVPAMAPALSLGLEGVVSGVEARVVAVGREGAAVDEVGNVGGR